jgi:imidazolonepropionase-like amidohydrolase
MHRLSLFLTAVLSLAATVAGAAPLAITKVTIIDATGRPPVEDGVIVMDNGRIVAVGPASTVTIPHNAKVVEKAGKYVIPGLMDASLHLFVDLDISTLISYRGRYSDIVIEAAQLALKNGQTTVFDTWGPYADLKASRDRINTGQSIGPRIFFAGNIIGVGGPVSEDFRGDFGGVGLLRQDTIEYLNRHWTQGTGAELLWDTSDEVAKKIAIYSAKDIDFLRYISNSRQEKSFLAFSQESQNEIVKAGHDKGKTVQADVYSLAGMLQAIDAGADILTHCDITPERTIPEAIIHEMAAKKVSCSVLPVTKAYRESQGKELGTTYLHSWTNIKNLIDGGVNVMLSTEATMELPRAVGDQDKGDQDKSKPDNSTRLGDGIFFALAGLEQIGVDPMKALQAATINTARGYKLDKDLGTLEPGKYADMVVLDANPLASASNYRSINMVIKSAEIVDLVKLPREPLIFSQKILKNDATAH